MGFNGDLYQESGATSVMSTKGDIARYNTERERYGIGSTGQVLQVASSLPTWSTINLADSVLTTQGDILYEGASALARLGFGTSGDVLTTKGTGANPVWETPSTVVGQQDMSVPSSAMFTTTTNGAEYVTAEIGVDKPMTQTFDFDDSTEEHAQFCLPMPRNFNNGTITASFYWLASSSSGDVVWSIAGRAYDDDDPMDASFGTEQTVTSTMTATDDMNISSFTSAMTFAGTPADSAMLQFQVSRNASDGNDTLGADAKLVAVVFTYTLDASTT